MTPINDIENNLLNEEKTNDLIDKDTNTIKSKKTLLFIIKTSLSTVLIVINSPIITVDIIYAFSKIECLNLFLPNFHINMKTYLLVSGFTCVLNLVICILIIWLYNFNDKSKKIDNIIINNTIIVLLSFSYIIFQTIWNIIGVVVLYKLLCNKSLCANTVINYLFISIIIKLLFNILTLIYNCKKYN